MTRTGPALLALNLAFFISSSAPVMAQTAPAETAPVEAAPPFNPQSQSIAQKGREYKTAQDEASWQAFQGAISSYLSDPRVLRVPAAKILEANPVLKDIDTRILDAGGARVFSFNGAKSARQIFIQSQGQGTAPGVPSAQVSLADIPESVTVQSARIARSMTTIVKTVKVRRKTVTTKTVKPDGPAYLVVTGLDRTSGLIWLGAYKQSGGGWMATQEPFSRLPGHFLASLSGQASFSGNDLVLAVSSKEGSTSQLPRPRSTSYQIVLKFSGGFYQVAGSPGKDMPLSVASYFVQCYKLNRLDLAKAWLVDPALISIPKYAKLEKMSLDNMKLVAMSNPGNGNNRYRLVTGDNTDLIFDIGKVKTQFLIKSIFAAPPDSLSRSLTGVPLKPTPPASEPVQQEGSPQASKPSSGNTQTH